MKVRFGVALASPASSGPAAYVEAIDALDELRFDSVWLPETMLGDTLDPLVGLAYAAARAPRLKLGMHIILPGRTPVRLARQLAELDQLSGGRLLVTGVLGLDTPEERAAQGLPTGDRGRLVDEVLPKLRAWWAGEEVDRARLPLRPLQQPLEVWLGGRSPAALRRIGRIGDGWLTGFSPLAVAVAGRRLIDDEAAAHGREISPEHFGTNLLYAWEPPPPEVAAALRARRPDAAEVGDDELVPVGADALRRLVGRWVDAGFTKFVLRPAAPPRDGWRPELERLAAAVLDLTT